MDLQTLIQDERDKSARGLTRFLETRQNWEKSDPSFKAYVDNLRPYLTLGGKMHRPWLTRLAFEVAQGNPSTGNLLLASLSTEVFHRFILCHDDIIDRDLTRHGQPTLEKVYQAEQTNLKPAKPMTTYAMGMAMEAGDLLHTLTYDLIFESGFPLTVCRQVIRGFEGCAFETVAGWRLESILKQKTLVQVTFKEVERAMILVSAKYTLVWPLRIGELMAGITYGHWISSLETYGLKVGLAFQIQDDILGIFGDEQATGKPVGGDLREGKKSWIILKGYELANKRDKERLEAANGGKITPAKLKEVQQILQDTGALAWAQTKAQTIANEGARALNTIKTTKNQETITRLQILAAFLAHRNR